jgi:hypothetical protein
MHVIGTDERGATPRAGSILVQSDARLRARAEVQRVGIPDGK